MSILSKTVTWGDASEEAVVIGDDYSLSIGGETKHYIGMTISGYCPDATNPYNFWESDNVAHYTTLLSYLQSKGIRLIKILVNHTSVINPETEATRYAAYLDLFYDHKMICIPHFSIKNITGFNDAIKGGDMANFAVGGGIDTLGAWLGRALPILDAYDNFIAINCDNELDNPLGGQDYDVDDVQTYITWFKAQVDTETSLPTTHNITSYAANNADMKTAILNTFDIPGIDCYRADEATIASALADMKSTFDVDKFWNHEVGYYSGGVNQQLCTHSFVNTVLKAGATMSIMWTSNSPAGSTENWFDGSGDPRPNMVELAGYIQSLEKIGQLV